ncbi:hypothetical protein PVAG01_08813 [Phlyctema vagabunda]|uniref:Uncharacterized protein n=1 Tax=Phlyctema vagabunda TaxID=108571 RepID=A0ABR4PAK9_9HELO
MNRGPPPQHHPSNIADFLRLDGRQLSEGCLAMPGVSSMSTTEPMSPRPKRSFADFGTSSTRSGTIKRLRIDAEEAEQTAKNFVQSVQQPKPLPRKRPYASFLEAFVEQLPSNPALNRYRPEYVDSSVTQWVESGSGTESYRGKHCRSDTLLGHKIGDLIPRRLTKSAPNMECRRDADGFVLPPTPTSTGSRSCRADAEDDSQASWDGPSVAPSDISGASAGSNRKSLVEDPYYRDNNLAHNNIYLRSSREQFPD